MVSLLLNLNRFINSCVFIANFEQLIFIATFDACWDDNDNSNDDKSHDEDVDTTDFAINRIQFFYIGGRGSVPKETQDPIRSADDEPVKIRELKD